MKSDMLEKIFSAQKFQSVDKNKWMYCDYLRQSESLKEKGIKSIDLKCVIDNIKNSKNFTLFESMINNIKSDVLYKSFIHGELHNERVSLFSYYLCNHLDLDLKDVKLAMYAAMYHDVGRKDDSMDDLHGERSAKKLKDFNLDVSKEELDILKLIITCHSLPDKKFNEIAKQYKIENLRRAKILFNILKDADGLDRTRLPYPYVNEEMLRNKISPSLILASYNLVNFYLNNKKELNQEFLI